MIKLEINTTGSVGDILRLLSFTNPLDDDRIIKAVIKRGVELLKEEASTVNYKFSDGTDIVRDMQGEVKNNNSGVLFNNNKKMPFIEFGTGIVGQGTSKFDQSIIDQMGWVYNSKENGWWYPTENEPPMGQPSFYDTNKKQWYAWTRGQEAKNIFYNATLRLQREMPSIIIAEIGKKIRKEVR